MEGLREGRKSKGRRFKGKKGRLKGRSKGGSKEGREGPRKEGKVYG